MFRRLCFAILSSVAVSALACLPLHGQAQTQGIDFAPGVTRFDFTSAGVPSLAVGYQFTVSADVSVYNLGFYDSGFQKQPASRRFSHAGTRPHRLRRLRYRCRSAVARKAAAPLLA